jgi:hypothetical protein
MHKFLNLLELEFKYIPKIISVNILICDNLTNYINVSKTTIRCNIHEVIYFTAFICFGSYGLFLQGVF